VIDGVAPPDMVLPASFSTDNQAALDALFTACEQAPACRARHPALRAQWQQLLAAPPREATVTHPLTGASERLQVSRELLLAMVRLPLYVPALASALPQALADAAQGRLDTLAALASGLQGRRGAMSLAEGMHFSVLCSEDLPRLQAAADPPGRDFGTDFAQLYRRVCAGWPRGEVPADFYRLVPAATPTLVLSGAIDPVTPPRHGERVAQALGAKARHVVVPHTGHGVLSVGCMGDVVYRFVEAEDDAQALAVDARCVQAIPRPLAAAPIRPAAPAASAVAVPPVVKEGAR